MAEPGDELPEQPVPQRPGVAVVPALRRWIKAAVAGFDRLALVLGFQLKAKDLQTAIGGVFTLLRLGPWGIIAFGLLVGGLIGFALVLFSAQSQRLALLHGPVAQLFLSAVAALAFALLNAETRIAHPLVRFVVALYTLWYLLLPPVLALPRLVALIPAFALYFVETARLRQGHGHPLWLLPWALLLGRLSPLLLSRLRASVGLWALFYAAVGFTLYRRLPARPLPERTLLFTAMALTYGASLFRNGLQFGEALQMGFAALFTFLGLFWMWLATDLVDDMAGLAVGVAGLVGKVLHGRWLPAAIALLWTILGAGAALFALFPQAVLTVMPPPLVPPLVAFYRDAWVEGLATMGMLAVAVGLTTAWRTRRGHGLADVAADSLASGLALVLVYWAGVQAQAGVSDIDVSSGWWPLLLATGPVLLEQAKQAARGIHQARSALGVAAIALLGMATTGFQFALEPEKAIEYTTLYPFLGILLWGIPHLVARVMAGWAVEVPSLRLFLAGYFSALPAALLVPTLQAGSPALAVLLWPLVLTVAGWEALEGVTLRLAAGLLVASGTLAFYYAPLFLPVPFLPWTEVLLQRLGQVKATELFSLAMGVSWLGAGLAGVIAALVPGRMRWLAAAAVWFAWCRFIL